MNSRPEQGRPAGGPGRNGDGFSVLSYLITCIGLLGAGGWALDRWLGTPFFLPAGVLLGLGVSLYLIYLRYVKS